MILSTGNHPDQLFFMNLTLLLRKIDNGWTVQHGDVLGIFNTWEEACAAHSALSNGQFADCGYWRFEPITNLGRYVLVD